MKMFLSKFTVTLVVLTNVVLDVQASECCTWNNIDCPSEWCSSSAEHCGTCGGIWADLALNPLGCWYVRLSMQLKIITAKTNIRILCF